MPEIVTASVGRVLPTDAADAILVGRIHDPEADGPCVVAVAGTELIDLTSAVTPTMAQLLATPDPAAHVRAALTSALAPALAPAPTARRWSLASVLNGTGPRLLAPVDLQVVKACGVTFVDSMLERVIEERAGGDPAAAQQLRRHLGEAIGGAIDTIRPGSAEAVRVKEVLQAQGLWSQYLEVGIGPDPEVFTKCPVLAAVGHGDTVGLLAASRWNNPEPEVVLLVDPHGRCVGATLGNDVNLRDIEGRSALLLGRAKDNNASAAIGPFVRILDQHFTLDDVRTLDVHLRVTGDDGFGLEGTSSMSRISRDPDELIAATIGSHHQYPDGVALFTGTLFAPVQDRDVAGGGFTHHLGDVVEISTPQLGTLSNRVGTSEELPPWQYGITALMHNLAGRGLLGP